MGEYLGIFSNNSLHYSMCFSGVVADQTLNVSFARMLIHFLYTLSPLLRHDLVDGVPYYRTRLLDLFS